MAGIGVTTRVTGSLDSQAIRQMVDRQARTAVDAGARTGALVARSVASQRTATGQMGAIRVIEARRTPTGYVAEFVSYAKHAWYQNDGTLGGRYRRLRRPYVGSRSRVPGKGIAPLHFLYFGLGAGRKAMARVIGIPDWRR
jgi:hypothetical protein